MPGRTYKRCVLALVVLLGCIPRPAAADMLSPLLVGTRADEAARGLLGWGVQVEVPVVGVLGDTPLHRRASWGSLIGAAVSVPIWQGLEARLQVSQSRTYDGSMDISYASGNTRPTDNELAQWRAVLAALGATYVWGDGARPWAPYVGLDAVAGYGGYALVYTDELAKNLEQPPTTATTKLPTPHIADGGLWGAQGRAGLRLQLAAWLSTQTEVGVTVLPLGAVPVTNNRAVRDVTTVPHTAMLVYGVFMVRVAL